MTPEEIQKIQNELYKQLAPRLNALTIFNSDFLRQMNAVTQSFQQIHLVTEAISKSLVPTFKILEQLESSLELSDIEGWKAYTEEFGWIETISFAYAKELKNTLVKNGKEETWKQLMQDLRDGDLLSEFESELGKNILLERRKKILNKCLEHHRNGDYISSVPLLLTQIEGILWDYAIKKGKIENLPNGKKLLDANGKEILGKKGKPIEAQFDQIVKFAFQGDSAFKKYATNSVYNHSFRHPILHGRQTEYASEQRSAMLLLMLLVINDQTNGAM